MSTIIGLTGMSGSGKSTASKILSDISKCIVDCDTLARKVITQPPCIDEVRAVFPQIFNENGVFDRIKARKHLFSDKAEIERYQEIVFPYVMYAILREISTNDSTLPIVLDAPTLFESGANNLCSIIIAIIADESTCISRITERDKISVEDAKMRLNNQPHADFYRKNCDYVITNNGKLDDFLKDCKKIAKII
ncbi:MAG: dephospho-CoA kinase [Oscillospiraceae bacterium]|nr:dephospho-CoA kinase [Oscillospiraceae bacterium]